MSDLELTMMRRVGELKAENALLKAEVERLTKQNALATPRSLIASQDIKTLREQVERLTKAVASSPVAQAKLKELECKTTFEEINPKDDNSNITTELLVLCNRQASDIRRLTKAGDAFEEEFGYLTESLRMLDNERVILKQVLAEWNAAKEGKPQP